MQKLLVIVWMLLLTVVGHARNYVVCVGVADYPGTENDLKLSGHDAVTMQTLYQKNGDAEVALFTDQRALLSEVRQELRRLFLKASADDAIVFFFSGHGVPGAFVCYDGFLKYDEVIEAMGMSAAKKKIILADACFAGKARLNGKHGNQANYSDRGVVFFLSSRTAERSLERRSWRNSLFTAYVERGLRGGADTNRDRVVTAKELFDFVSKGVAKKSGGRQHPVMWGNFADNMSLMVWPQKN